VANTSFLRLVAKALTRVHVVAFLIGALGLVPLAAQDGTGVSHAIQLTPQTSNRLADGTVVVTSVATGELRGIVTLTMRPTEDGGYSGEWAFTVSHAEHADPATGIEPDPEPETGEPDPDHPHRDFYTLIFQGALSGSISSGQVTVDEQGNLTDVSASLVIDQGSLEFEGKTGSGQATLSALTLQF
jgi:hypothetical protein